MSQFIVNLPPVPDTGYNNYVVYHPGSDIYRISFFDTLPDSGYLDEQGILYYSSRVIYNLNQETGEWEYYTSYTGGQNMSDFGNWDIVASTVDIYNADGTVFCSGASVDYVHNGITMVGGLTSSFFTQYLLSDVRGVLPIVVPAIVCMFAFRKALNFLIGSIRGA